MAFAPHDLHLEGANLGSERRKRMHGILHGMVVKTVQICDIWDSGMPENRGFLGCLPLSEAEG